MRLARCAALALAFALPIAAQEPDDAAAQERARSLLSGLTGADERLLGVTKFTLYAQKLKLGEMVLTVERHADAAQGAYRVKLEAKISAGGNTFENLEELALGADLGARSGNRRKSEQQGETKKEERQVLTPVPGGWELTRSTDASPEQKAEVKLEGPNHCSLASLLLITRQLDLTKEAAYVVQATRWKEGVPAPGVFKARLLVQPAARKVKRGDAEVEVAAVKVLREGESEMTVLLDAERRLVELLDDSKGVRFVVGEAAPAAAPVAGSEDALGAVVTYLRILARAEPVEALDRVMDWDAIYAAMCVEDENVKILTAAQLTEILRQQFAQAEAGITVEQVDALKPTLEVKLDGDAAEVLMPGAAPFKLRKGETGWKITYFPH
jgi:hypothetical protein